MASTPVRNFEPASVWSDSTGRLSPRAAAWTRAITDFIGAGRGSIPIGALGGDGVTTTAFLREDGSFAVPNYPAGASPSAEVGETAVVGVATTFMRSDAAPALNLGITPTWTGLHTFSAGIDSGPINATNGTFTGTMSVATNFGCNGASPQASAAVSGAVAGSAGATYTAAEQTLINSMATLLNQLRAALVANGIAV